MLGSQRSCCSYRHFVDRILLVAHQAVRIAVPWVGGNFAQSAKDRKKYKVEDGKKRVHIGRCEKKRKEQRADGWRKEEIMKKSDHRKSNF